MKALWAFKDEAKAAGQRGEGAKVVKAAGQWLRDPSVLVRHEVCYVVGQSCGDEAVDFLSEVLSDEAEVRARPHSPVSLPSGTKGSPP